MREVSRNTFGNDATLLLGNITNNIISVNPDFSAADITFLQEISKTNPVDDKKRILESKGPLIYDSFCWILEHNGFKKWRDKQTNGVFWIKGGPGKGKTMLLCGIIEDLENDAKLQKKIVYFFCQGTDNRLNTAAAIIKGLIYSVLRENQNLLSSIQKQIEKEPKGYLEGTNAWVALRKIFTTIIQDPCMADSIFIIDGLDECQQQESRKSLLNLITDTSSHIKWLVSSRNEREIERGLRSIDSRLELELKSNATHVSEAVDTYIDRCARDIEALEDDDDLRSKTIELLKKKANGTFLWVTLVVKQLRDAGRPHIERVLEEMPEDLESLYDEIMERSKKGWKRDKDACLVFLATVTAAERPLHMDELYLFISSQLIGVKVKYLPSDVEYLAKACGSFITITDKTIYLIHQSVKDYMTQKGANSIFRGGIELQHSKMFEISLNILDKILRCDIYNIKSPGEHMDNITSPNPDPLASKAYCCAFWIEHLAHCSQSQLFQDGGILQSFLKAKFLNWLEAMVLLKLLPQAVIAIQRLRDLFANGCIIENNGNRASKSYRTRKRKRSSVRNGQRPAYTAIPERKSETLANSKKNEMLELIRDVYRLVFLHRAIIEAYPLQIYASALIFSPSESISRKLFMATQCPKWIVSTPETNSNWSPCLQTIEDNNHIVTSVAISPDSTMLAAVENYDMTKLWDLMSGALLRTLKTKNVIKVIFSSDNIHLALLSSREVEIWDLITGTRFKTFDGDFNSASFCGDGTHLALMGETTVEIHDITINEDFHTHTIYSGELPLTLIFSSDCAQLNSGFRGGGLGPRSARADTGAPVLTDRPFHGKLVVSDPKTSTIKVLDLATGRCLHTTPVTEHIHWRFTERNFKSSSDGMRLAVEYDDVTDIWNLATGNCIQTLETPSLGYEKAIVFSADGLRLASTQKNVIKIWDIATGTCLQTFVGHTDTVFALAYSLDGLRLVSGSGDFSIKVWDLAAKSSLQIETYSDCHNRIGFVAISPNGRWIALGSADKTVRIWDTAKRTFLRTMKMSNKIKAIAFSLDSMQLATAEGAYDHHFCWDKSTGAVLDILKGFARAADSTTPIFPSNTQLALRSRDGFIKIWDLASGRCLHTIKNDLFTDLWIEFSPTDTLNTTIWDIFNGVCTHETFSGPIKWKSSEFDEETPLVYFSQGRRLYYYKKLPMLSLSDNHDWILKSGNPLLWLLQTIGRKYMHTRYIRTT